MTSWAYSWKSNPGQARPQTRGPCRFVGVSGAADGIAEAIAASAPLIVDIIYDPWPTALAIAAERAGCTVVTGFDLLIGQALLQIELMTSRSVAADVLRAALDSELLDRQRACKDC